MFIKNKRTMKYIIIDIFIIITGILLLLYDYNNMLVYVLLIIGVVDIIAEIIKLIKIKKTN